MTAILALTIKFPNQLTDDPTLAAFASTIRESRTTATMIAACSVMTLLVTMTPLVGMMTAAVCMTM